MSVPSINHGPPDGSPHPAAPPQGQADGTAPAPPTVSQQPSQAPQGYATGARGLLKVYGSCAAAVRALDHVDVGFPRGQFSAITGPPGSGKSTLMHCLTGLDTPPRARWCSVTCG